MRNSKQSQESNNDGSPAETGNASNPIATNFQPDGSTQLLDKNAEKYLRESGNIEDMPDDEDQQD